MTRTFANPVAHACRVCGRPSQIDDLCGRHGGSVGLVVQTEDLGPWMRIGLRFMVAGAALSFFLGLLTLALAGSLTGREDSASGSKLVGVVMMAVGLVSLFVAMYLSQLRRWAYAASVALCAGVGIVSIVLLAMTSPSSSFSTLLLAGTTFPYLVAALLFVVWRLRQPRSDVRATGGAPA